MSDDYRKELMGEWPKDPVMDAYVLAWLAYHWAAEGVDGHLKRPDGATRARAIMLGSFAMSGVLNEFNLPYPKWRGDPEHYARWQAAKREAVRMQERGITVAQMRKACF